MFNNLFFNPERYDLSKVGRLKLNYKFKLDEALDNLKKDHRPLYADTNLAKLVGDAAAQRALGGVLVFYDCE